MATGPEEPRRPRPAARPDLNRFWHDQGYRLQITPTDTPEQIDSRIRIDEAKALHELWERRVSLLGAMGGMALIALVCVVCLVRPGHSPDDQKWAVPILTAIGMSLAAYFAGQRSKPHAD